MTYSIEEAREAYATDKITLDEYKLAIDRAVEAARPQPRRRLPRWEVLFRKPATMTRYQRNRRAWIFWWSIISVISWLAGLAISVASQIAHHHSLVQGLVMTSLITFAVCLIVGIVGLGLASVNWDA